MIARDHTAFILLQKFCIHTPQSDVMISVGGAKTFSSFSNLADTLIAFLRLALSQYN